MANNLSALAPVAYSAAKEVANEPFGVVDAVNANFDDKGVAKGDTVKVPVAPTRTATDFTPSNIPGTGDDSTATEIGVTITASKKVSWNITGEQQRSLENAQADKDWFAQMLKQGMRTIRNLCEVDAWTAAYQGASRAYGAAGTTPFASDLTAITNVRKILHDNGAPLADLQFVAGTSAGLNLRNLTVFQQANLAGDGGKARMTGDLPRQFGFQFRESAAVGTVTKGTGSAYTTDTAGYAKGATQITLITGSGTVLAGDVVTFAGDTNKYVVASGVSAPGAITLAAPGLQQAIPASATAMTIGANYTANLAMERDAVVGIMRPPIMPANPTIQQLPISDPFGMTYLLLHIAQYGQLSMELHLAWGFKAVNSEFAAIALG